MAVDTSKELLLTTAEAVALVKRSERTRARFNLHVRLDAAVEGKPDHVFESGLHSYLRLSRADALHLVKGLLSEALEAKGGRIRIVEHRYENGINGPETVYWIG